MAEFIIGNPLRKLAREHPALQRALWRVDFALLWVLVKLFSAVPIDFASRFGDRLGRFVGPKLNQKSLIFKKNVMTAFPDLNEQEAEELVTRAWGRAGRILAEYPHLPTISADPERLIVDIRQEFTTHRDPRQPCVFVTSHQSNWEVVVVALLKLGIPSANLYSPPSNPLLDKMLLESRRALNCELIPRDNSARMLVRALKQGRSIGMVIDRRVDEGKPVLFFGQNKVSTIMPAWLALKFDCELIPVQVERIRDARYRVIFHPAIVPASSESDPAEQATDMTARVHSHFEQWAREQPQDWFCSKRLWPKNNSDNLKFNDPDDGVTHHAS